MQEAGGASLDDDQSPAESQHNAGSRRRLRWAFVLIALVGYVADQVTKSLAVQQLTGEPDKPLIGEVLQLHLTRNPGAAFSTGTQYTPVLTGLAILAVCVVLWISRRLGSRWWALGLGLLLAGVAGNLTDRMAREPGAFHGHVIDFLMLPNWPVFNVADICINLAAGVILLQAVRGIRVDGTRDRDALTSQADDEADDQEAAR